VGREASSEEIESQRRYYAATADRYDRAHVHDTDEHALALHVLLGVCDSLGVRSILDVGSGTGRAMLALRAKRPELRVVGIEPVEELRKIGHAKGLCESELLAGEATAMEFGDAEFDAVCAFGVLHHIRHPASAVAEMLRVARRLVFISDSNCFGQGRYAIRTLKQAINALGLWNAATFIKTWGRGYTISEGDGLAYSYSVFNDYARIRASCESVHVFNTERAGMNPYRSAGHVALLGIKQVEGLPSVER
jgi:ubiquinone/menaquinone biosynthesis C-methylase UbiE